MKKSILLVLIAGLSGVAFAHNHGDPEYMKMRQAQFVDRYDADSDGRVSSVEFEQARRFRFDITDEDQSGTVSEEEYVYEWEDRLDTQLAVDRESAVKQTSRRFAALDRDEDNAMAWAEYAASGERMFTGHDTDENGEISSADPKREYQWRNTQQAETAEEKAEQHARLIARANRALRMPSTHTTEGMMAKYDTDDDGIITRAEFDATRKADFERTDANENGSVDEEEYVMEFEDRLDAQIAETRAGSVKQAGRRFHALDDDDNDIMTFAEYQQSGHRMFKRWDTGADGYVSLADALPEPREQATDQIAAADSNSTANTTNNE